MESIFTKIIKKKQPEHFLWRDSKCVAFLSTKPITTGHSLIVPIQEIDHWLDLPIELVQHITKVGHHVGIALQKVFKPTRIGTMIAGFEIPHTHLHVLCVNSLTDMNFANAKQNVNPKKLANTAKLLRNALNEAGHLEFVSNR